ncbi:MAG: hypothetical protein H8E66_17435 [Planctomycetes bacterium]|nr:hypothetical protein [Planctomycetota bacterium]
MQFRRGGQGDERRRRVFRDEMTTSTDRDEGNAPQSPDEGDGRIYSDAALAQRQAPLTSLLPQRTLTLVALLLVGGVAIAGIELLYARLFVGLPESFQSSLAAFDLTTRGNIADWFASLTLGIGAATSTLVYVIRRHRLDDYRGRYRVWQWATVCFVIASFDATTHAHTILQPSMIQLTGTTLLADGSVWSVLLVGLTIAACLVRVAIEVRGSRLAITFVCLAAGSYIGFVVTNFHPALTNLDLARVVASSSTLLAAHFCLVYAVALYGRHVYQEAQGTRRAGRTKPVVSKEEQLPKTRKKLLQRERAAGSKTVRVDSTHEKSNVEATPLAVPSISKKSVRTTSGSPTEDESEDNSRPMSKAERRRLRKLQRRQQRQGFDHDE